MHDYSLRWFSRGASVGGAKVKLCIWAVCGSSGRPVVSPGMSGGYIIRIAGEAGVGDGVGVVEWQRGCSAPSGFGGWSPVVGSGPMAERLAGVWTSLGTTLKQRLDERVRGRAWWQWEMYVQDWPPGW